MKIAIIVGSVRLGCVSDRLAIWVKNEVDKHADSEIIDLKDYPMPFMEESSSPRFNPQRKPTADVQKWLNKIVEFDGYIIVTPEYNRSTSAVLKNAIDYIDYQLEDKPVGLVGHGSTGGAQAIETLRSVLPQIGVVTLPPVVYFSNRVDESVNEDGKLSQELLKSAYGPQNSLDTLVQSLFKYTTALSEMRNKESKKQ